MQPSNPPYAGPPPHALRMGDVLGLRFRILRLIGAGGMGEVYEAADQELGVSVALKTIRYDPLGASEDTLERFRQEAKLARQVTHPNVCRIFDVGRDGDRLYLTMELIQGETLAGMMQREGRMQADTALALARQMAAGLDALHAQGLVHRDFKPANVLIAESRGERRVVITDFGLTRVRDETVTMLAPGVARIAGTPDYMAPEQLLGKTLTPATDVYALGLVLYEMVTGTRAYPGGGMLENTAQRLAQAPDPPSSHDPQLPRHWDKVILRCLERDATARPASAGAVAAALAGADLPAGHRAPHPWLLAAAAAVILPAVYFAPRLHPTRPVAPAFTTSGSAHETFLKAQDALDHYYRPHGVENAMRLFQATVDRDPRFATGYAGLARANFYLYWQMRDARYIDPARSDAEKALALDATLASVHVTLGRLYTETGKTDLAAQELNEALRLDPRGAEAYYALAALYDAQGRTADVVPNYQKAMDLKPEEWQFPDNLADFYLRTGKPEQALEMNRLAVRLTPDNPRALNNLGRTYRRLGRLADARAAYEKAIQIEPAYSRYANLGVILDDLGKPVEAADAYRKALQFNPSSYVVRGNLGSALAAVPGQEAESREEYQKAASLAEDLRKSRPDDPELLSILGRDYAALGETEKSLPLLRQAVALAPQDPNVWLRAATSYEVLHRRDDALTSIERALSDGLLAQAAKAEPALAGLRQDPQFVKLLARYSEKH
jgi:eukaryotic-like serine/threonine-protein kinase